MSRDSSARDTGSSQSQTAVREARAGEIYRYGYSGIEAQTKAGRLVSSADADNRPVGGWEPNVGADTIPLSQRPLLQIIDQAAGGLPAALLALDRQVREKGERTILAKLPSNNFFDAQLLPGQIGLVSDGNMPKVLLKSGNYPKWWTLNFVTWKKFRGVKAVNETVISFDGLLIVQVSQNQAAILADPANRIFLVRNASFCCYGGYKVIEVVDQTHLTQSVLEPTTRNVLGRYQEVSYEFAGREFVVAQFFDIPANNVAILQRKDELLQLTAGQHVVLDPQVTLRAFFTKGENQFEMPAKDVYTKDSVPVSLRLYLKWRLDNPLKLTLHGYMSAYEALRDKAQSILTQVVGHLEYAQMIKQRSLGPELDAQPGNDSLFLDALKTHAMDELHGAAVEYGIDLRDLAVIDRNFKGDVAAQMDQLTTRALQAQVDAANIQRENQTKVQYAEGEAEQARVRNAQQIAKAEAEKRSHILAAEAEAEALRIQSEAKARATLTQARAEAEAAVTRGEADGRVPQGHARQVQRDRIGVQKVAAYGNRTVFVPFDGAGAGAAGQSMVGAYGAGLGAGMATTEAQDNRR